MCARDLRVKRRMYVHVAWRLQTVCQWVHLAFDDKWSDEPVTEFGVRRVREILRGQEHELTRLELRKLVVSTSSRHGLLCDDQVLELAPSVPSRLSLKFS